MKAYIPPMFKQDQIRSKNVYWMGWNWFGFELIWVGIDSGWNWSSWNWARVGTERVSFEIPI